MSKAVSRRHFAAQATRAGVAGLVLAAGYAPAVIAAAKAHIVILGGGPAGTTLARRLARSGRFAITLIEAKRTYTSCFFSNLYIGGLRSYESITHRYDKLAALDGVRFVPALAERIDTERKRVTLRGGTPISYDRLVLAPGIDFKAGSIDGYDSAASERMPHAYLGGAQIRRLNDVVRSMRKGGLFVIAPPPEPYRCPPGPYERVSMIARWFTLHNPSAKILILDAKNKHAKQTLFQRGWERFYPGMIEWLPAEMTNGGVRAVRASSMQIVTIDETFTADAACIIPAQSAGRIALDSGLGDASNWCPVDASTLASRKAPDVHVLGDAIIAGDMPKSAFAAHSQAQVCADAIVAELLGKPRDEASFSNACWSSIADGHAVKVGARYAVIEGEIKKVGNFLSELDETDERRRSTALEADAWYSAIVQEMFG